MVISIDGPAASGKSTTAELLSNKLGFIHLNSGLLFRGITYLFLKKNIITLNESSIDNFFLKNDFNLAGENLNKVIWNSQNISQYLFMENINESINDISNSPLIRNYLIDKQRALSFNNDIVCEGRDIGTVVFPDADFKFYLVATIESRASRRFSELKINNSYITRASVMLNLINRDKNDINRQYSPLRKADDAIEIDTTNMSVCEQMENLYKQIKQGTIND
tara:strand:- start:136 stop:801 length:666 start_codon:yes stop_codon:yes gene_type:complete